MNPPTSPAPEPLNLGIHGTIQRWTRGPSQPRKFVGTNSSVGLAALLLGEAGRADGRPQLVVLASLEEVRRLELALRFFQPGIELFILPAFDVDAYSGLTPHRRIGAQRVAWLYGAQNARPGQIFLAPMDALMQRTLPYKSLKDACLTLRPGDSLPKDFFATLASLGYDSSPLVEDLGTYAARGGIVDVFSPAQERPFRLELFGDTIDSIRLFEPDTQRSDAVAASVTILPAQEIIFSDDGRERAAKAFRDSLAGRAVEKGEAQEVLHQLTRGAHFPGLEFLVSAFYRTPGLPLEHFSESLVVWLSDPTGLSQASDRLHAELKDGYLAAERQALRPAPSDLFCSFDAVEFPAGSHVASVQRLLIEDSPDAQSEERVSFGVSDLKEFTSAAKALSAHGHEFASHLGQRIKEWRSAGQRVFLSTSTESQAQRLRLILERSHLRATLVGDLEHDWVAWLDQQESARDLVHIIPRRLAESAKLNAEEMIFLRDEDLFGRKTHRKAAPAADQVSVQTDVLQFSELKLGDLIVHKIHGVGQYEGLKVISLQGIDSELIQLKYKDNDRLYLPVYRISQIHKFSAPNSAHALDKLGGSTFEKAKVKVRRHLRDVASDLLSLYATRSQHTRSPLAPADEDYLAFEAAFPYDETADQLRTMSDVLVDLTEKDRPMDRLICGDVGFGKTEMALRAAFKVVQSGQQVAIIAPTTVLTMQHTETFKRRFKDWPVRIGSLNRFVPRVEVTKTVAGLKDGSVDLVIGTHRLLSRDIEFKNLGLLIIDEEQKFGVQHKERLRRMKTGVDTLTLSATPIPRTLNMSLMGLRDLSIINTPPADRLPTRTFVCKFDEETIRKAVESELSRGGQIFFIHNRIESIYGLMDELRRFLPNVRMGLGHGQMPEEDLEKVMVSFFHGEIDMLVCTTIVESGMDVPRANTMFIDNAHQLGLSQLYQLRGRVGRSKERAYCYLLVPPDRKIDKEAQERLRVIQENTALGSGIRIAQHDLELRGAGDLLGEDQSGHINAVGYELYLELLDEAVRTARGESPVDDDIEPEINVRIPALIPDSYMPDIRLRLSYYRKLSEIRTPEDIDRLEDELRDQFGKPPEQVINLMGLMLVRRLCKELRVKDLASGKSGISLLFTDKTPLPPERVLEIAQRSNKKYSLTPDSRLNIRMSEISWPRLHEELSYLLSLCP